MVIGLARGRLMDAMGVVRMTEKPAFTPETVKEEKGV
jgi:hypothetical protein